MSILIKYGDKYTHYGDYMNIVRLNSHIDMSNTILVFLWHLKIWPERTIKNVNDAKF